jgi:hypothetical protein
MTLRTDPIVGASVVLAFLLALHYVVGITVPLSVPADEPGCTQPACAPRQ